VRAAARARSDLLKVPGIEQQIYSWPISSKSLILFIVFIRDGFACLKILYTNAGSAALIFADGIDCKSQHYDFIEVFRLSWSWHGLCNGLII
jgi:hypothetical protein